MGSLIPEPVVLARAILRNNTNETITEQDYGYTPSESAAIAFVVIFGLSTLVHAGQAAYFKTWGLLPTAVLAGIGEIAGWSGRLWSSLSATTNTAFKIQIPATIIAPTFLLAVSFMVFSRVTTQLGSHYSLLPPRLYLWVFFSCDFIALIAQGIGGGRAAAATTLSGASTGAKIMLGGIGFQFAVITIFTFLVLDFIFRKTTHRPYRPAPPGTPGGARGLPLARMPHLKIVLAALMFSNTVFFIRSVYRLIELAGGWEGRIIHTQVYFTVLDGGMIALAILTWNVVHPGLFFPSKPPPGMGMGMSGEGGEGEGKGNIEPSREASVEHAAQ
ncbi:hypothetical protein HMN09_00921800 [Mycena chlorophos]|uniref:RTA1-domain-containing protein n=1 Tax=Mycena chlorophos TaxID=658473 RepID=A0A8H6W5U5_MYCCL|nr:hypothetical protein HMN09_00921800 [Mycena chlorophos]